VARVTDIFPNFFADAMLRNAVEIEAGKSYICIADARAVNIRELVHTPLAVDAEVEVIAVFPQEGQSIGEVFLATTENAAVLAERERCAKIVRARIALHDRSTETGAAIRFECQAILGQIRSGQPPVESKVE
jgi:hypothetical protein